MRSSRQESDGIFFAMKPISTSTYTFEDLIGGGYVYVDKTADIHVLASQAKVILVGAGFSLKTRNITRPRIETV